MSSFFQWTRKEGFLCQENMRGTRFWMSMHVAQLLEVVEMVPPTRWGFAAELFERPIQVSSIRDCFLWTQKFCDVEPAASEKNWVCCYQDLLLQFLAGKK